MSSSRSLPFFKTPDALLIALVIGAAGWGFLNFRISDGTRAVIYVADKKYGWYELAENRREISVSTRIGPLMLEIGNGNARVLAAPCPNQSCVKTGTIKHAHEEIICVPAQVLLILEGPEGSSEGGMDAITF